MSVDFIARLMGMVVFGFVGVRLGFLLNTLLNVPVEPSVYLFIGMAFGLAFVPYFTTRPVRSIRRRLVEWPAERLLLALVGLALGLLLALLVAYPFSLLPTPLNTIVPPAISVLGGYLGLALFGMRATEILDALATRFGTQARVMGLSSRKLLLDTSVLIDGRIADIAETGFVGGMLVVPQFVMHELHRVADSSDALRRNRGRRGLEVLNQLQRNDAIPLNIIEDDFEDIPAVDDKLVALALQMRAAIVTNDYNLNRVADAQGVTVLNINELANAVRSIYIPGETFAVRVIQEGTDPGQGVGYLEDGTMVVVENGRNYMDRSIPVEVTKLINRPTGRMIFAVPEAEKSRY